MDLKGKRLLGIDYGLKRIGLAICDELHITTTPIDTIENSKDILFPELEKTILYYNIYAIVVGIPFTKDGQKTKLILEIEKFIKILKSKFDLEVFTIDESYSSSRASEIMVQIGKKKSKRKAKGSIDKVASAIILRDFLDNIS